MAKLSSKAKISRVDVKRFLLTRGTRPMAEVVDSICRFFQYRVSPVLIIGETGSGKEYAARILLSSGQNFNKCQFYSRNCAAYLEDSLLRSELFGHLKGSFTGAERDRPGLLATVVKNKSIHGIFLDEIDKASRVFQNSLLRYLRTGEIQVVGSDEMKIIEITPVVLASSTSKKAIFEQLYPWKEIGPEERQEKRETNSHFAGDAVEPGHLLSVGLKFLPDYEMVEAEEEQSMSRDFLSRISNFTIEMPPLRNRLEDAAVIVNHFIRIHSSKLGITVWKICGRTIEFILGYFWPNNISEIEGFVRNGLLFQKRGVLSLNACLHCFGPNRREALNVFRFFLRNRLHGERYYKYLGIPRRVTELRNNGEFSCRWIPEAPDLFRLRHLERIFENVMFWSRNESPDAKHTNKIDVKRIDSYLNLKSRLKTKKQIYTELGFKSISPFNNWLRKNHLDY